MPSISVLTSLTLVCDSKRGLGNFTLSTQTRPSRTSSPERLGSFSFNRLLALAYWLMARVKAERNPVRCVPPSGFGMELAKQRNLIVVTIVVLQDAIDEDFVFYAAHKDRFGMDDLLVLAKLFDELFDALFVEKPFRLVFDPFIGQQDFHTWIQESQFPQTIGQQLKLELSRNGKDRRVRLECDQRSRVLGFANDFQFMGGEAPRELHEIHFSVARDLDFEPI